jgi:hypothetical protein
MKPYGTNRKGQPIKMNASKSENHKKGKFAFSRRKMYKVFNGSHRQFSKRQITNILNELN